MRPGDAGTVPMVAAYACEDMQPLKWAKVVRRIMRPPIIGSAVWVRGGVTGEEARAVWRAAEAASAGTTRRAGGIGLALATRPPVTTTGDDEASRHAISLALNAARGSATATATEDGGGRGARRRERRSASELGTTVAAKRLVAHVTQPVLWEPGVT